MEFNSGFKGLTFYQRRRSQWRWTTKAWWGAQGRCSGYRTGNREVARRRLGPQN